MATVFYKNILIIRLFKSFELKEFMMKSKNILSATAAALFLCVGFAHASDGTFNFAGALSSATCTITNQNGANIEVGLPSISVSALPTAGSVAGRRFFTIDIGACESTNSVKVSFDAGDGVDPATGNLFNTNANAAANVQAQILTADGTQIKPGDAAQAQAPAVTGTPVSSGKFTYIAQYVAVGGPAGAGVLDARVYYTLQYQ
ncbi:MAG: fimbrial protein [Limnohabitans sp.]